ncbi:hypothetical protein BU17DRAFT_60227 [Hysterangium stoloniferum]|nr:hypothetical protein BU17DRAFT_60227 [Hysterangium stoloniferum]
MVTWWSSGRKEFLKLSSWDLFKLKIEERFMPKGYKMIALQSFFLCEQGKLQLLDYATALAEAQNAVGISVISTYIYKCQLLFHSHPILLLHIMAMPEFNMETIRFDDLMSLLSMQWESLIAEGIASDDGWTDHVGRTCPGDATLGILPGHDFVPVKKETAGLILTKNNGEDQPDRATLNFHHHWESWDAG